MPSVQEELAALKKSGITKRNSTSISSKGGRGLSTPEQEEATLRAKAEKERKNNYSKDAKKTLNAGVKAIDQNLDFQLEKISNQKKIDKDKKKEATQHLQQFNTAKLKPNNTPIIPITTSTTPTAAAKNKNPPSTTNGAKKEEPPPKMEDKKETPATTATTTATTTTTTPKVETTHEDEDIPNLEVEPSQTTTTTTTTTNEAALQNETMQMQPPPPKQNRNEKKARKLMFKLGMKKVEGVARVTLKQRGQKNSGGGFFWNIDQPDVYEKKGSYIIFGEARQGGGGGAYAQQQQQQQARQQQAAAKAVANAIPTISEIDEDNENDGKEDNGKGQEVEIKQQQEETSAVLDETGINSKDIELVMSQVGCSRNKAVQALRSNDNDLVNAIMSLTS